MLAKRLACVMGGLFGEAQTCAISGRNIHDNLHLVCYSLERFEQNSGKRGALFHLGQSKAFDRVDHKYVVAVLEAAGLNPNFHRWIAAMNSDIESVVKVNGFFTKPF